MVILTEIMTCALKCRRPKERIRRSGLPYYRFYTLSSGVRESFPTPSIGVRRG